MNIYTALTVFAITGFCFSANARQKAVTDPCAITMRAHATHIASVERESITVINGSTYSFTVDTPEDQGLVSTVPDVTQLLQQIRPQGNNTQQYEVLTSDGMVKKEGRIANGDKLVVTTRDGKHTKRYSLRLQAFALNGRLVLDQHTLTLNTPANLVLYYTAGQRSPDASVRILVPAGINVTMDNTTVNVIGRGDVLLKDLATQSIGRVGTNYSYSKVGDVTITKAADGGTVVQFNHLDLRPANGADLRLVIRDVVLTKAGTYRFQANYTTASPAVLTSAGTLSESATLTTTNTITSFERVIAKGAAFSDAPGTYTSLQFTWRSNNPGAAIQLMQSGDQGKSWKVSKATIDARKGQAAITGLAGNQLYSFRLQVKDGEHKGFSNTIRFYSGKMDIKGFGVSGEDKQDNTEIINKAIDSLYRLGGGVLLFSKGTYSVRTVHLKSNVWLYIDKEATLKALKGTDAPESTWFSDRKYRSGLSPTDPGPYADPENYMTKQDVGHHYFRNGMFFAEREDNIKIIGNGHITGDGNLVTGDKVMSNAPDNRGDKMFVFKLCTNIEIGGLQRTEDLWYDAEKDEPYYIKKDGSKDADISNMLQIDRAGHFVLLATGTDGIYVHNSYFSRAHQGNVRDIYDFMGCNNVTATNIYCKVSSDDIIKPGSDCSLGFTRPASHYMVRNIIGDTNCNLFQIGSETADDIMDLHVDNIYVLGANKAGFSISTNDGAHIKDVHLNCGHTGPIHSRSKMYRATTPFFISISNRGRILGANVGKYAFTDHGDKHNELLVKNVNIGQVENIIINGIDIFEVYSGSSYSGKRWKPYDGTQKRSSPIIAGYKLPGGEDMEGKLDFTLPNGQHTGYINNVVFNDVHVLVKGGNPLSDTAQVSPELGVGQYNVTNLKVQPSFGLWARHVKALSVNVCSFNYEQPDGRYAIYLEDVLGAKFSGIKMMRGKDNEAVIKLKEAKDVFVDGAVYYNTMWGNTPVELPRISYTSGNSTTSFPDKGK
ncbi:endopygalactorunase [Paraflavitalea soli]|uniref:Endopygalactorunase n=1 Tax=Paraflavitalea soli TaxID=2315862 RepID=A0A3B7MVI2_9BACT|nr:endopygalactorunase [Paraflavitalea soli]AXY75655.1 endopygalactorunase [Paraflavitalea soli]